MFRHCLLAVVLFPAIIICLIAGSYWPLVYITSLIVIYLISDRFSIRSNPKPTASVSWLCNFCLLLQIPLSILLLLIFFLSITPTSPVTSFIVNLDFIKSLGLSLNGFHSNMEIFAAAIVVGFHLSTNFVVAHELIHKPGRTWKPLSRVLLAMLGDTQFVEAHLYGHHANVGTKSDPATAKRGESIYHFFIRSTKGQWQQAYAYENHRLTKAKRKGLKKLISHRVLRGNLFSLSLLALTSTAFGSIALLAHLIIMLVAKFLLETINYVQHYGLVREAGITVNASHSWDSDSLGSSLLLFNLTRHAQHHKKPITPCYKIQPSPQSPQIQGGYMYNLLLTLIPSLWFKIMEPKLEKLKAQQ